MDIKKILVIFLLIIIYSILFWPTLNIYTHTAQNILVKINRITGEAYYFLPGSNWKKISYEFITEPLELETKTYSGGVKFIPYNEQKKDYGSVEILGNE